GAAPALRSLVDRAVGAVFRGPVEDLPRELSEASAVVVPLRAGGGTRLKILEALGAARPVISTSVGAEGIDLSDGRDLLIADDGGAFANSVARVLEEPAFGEALGREGRHAVEARYDGATIRDAAASRLDGPARPPAAPG